MRRRRGRRVHPPHPRRDLQHTLFHWFGVAIVLSGLTAAAVSWAVGPGRASWHDEMRRLERTAARLFAERWHDPAARTQLARALAEEGELGLELSDARGRPLERHGGACRGPTERIAVRGEHELLGHVSVCVERPFRPPFWILGLLAAAFTLWLLSGRIAWRLARPLNQLAHAARELADGRLSARAAIAHPHVSEVAVLADSFNHMAARIERQISDQKQLLATVSHELRTPLTRMRILLELIRERDPGGENARTLDDLEAEILEMDELVGQTLASSRLDFSALQRRSLDVRALCERALSRAGVDPGKLVIENAGKDAADLQLEADPTLLARALANLLANARRHGGGVDGLVVRRSDREVCFEVLDLGGGIDPELEKRLFQPFVRGEGPGAGLGLGLALVQRIAQAHGGRVWAQRREPRGACVGFSVARASEQSPRES